MSKQASSIFSPAENTTAYAKVGLLGFQGAGKTYTACELAIGLALHCGAKKPVYFLDSETGSDWSLPRFKAAGVEVRVAKTGAFSDLLTGIEEAERDGFALIVDSVTHYWKELMDSYQRKHKIRRITLKHWMPLKAEWHLFSRAFVNSNLHVIVCGRAGWDWAETKDEDGDDKLARVGTKMKAESEFGFEPSLLIEMLRERDTDKPGAPVIHKAVVLKDRRMDGKGLDGKEFVNPTFADFLPHFECLALGKRHVGVDASRNSEARFDVETGESWESLRRRAVVLVEELNGELEAKFPGTARAEKTAKAALKKHLFGTYSDTAIEDMHPSRLQGGLAALRAVFAAENWSERVGEIVQEVTQAGQKATNEKE